jgi:alpha 1,3-glucosidase
MEYPNIPELYSVDNQFLIGSDLLVRPVTSAGAVSSEVKFPLSDCWYDVDTMQRIPVSGHANSAATTVLKSDINKIPVYQRGGSIIPRKLRLRRSSQLMVNDPYTLYIALDDNLKAEGVLYMDDETTFDHENIGDYAVAKFSSDWGDASVAIQSTVQVGNEEAATAKNKEARMIERIIVMGLEKEPKSIVSSTGNTIEFQYDLSSKVLVIRKPGVSAVDEWTLNVEQKI